MDLVQTSNEAKESLLSNVMSMLSLPMVYNADFQLQIQCQVCHMLHD